MMKLFKTNKGKFKIDGSFYTYDYIDIKVQSVAEDVNVYGWTTEARYKWDTGWSSWFSHRNKIYYSRESAMDSIVKSYTGGFRDIRNSEYRVTPIYKMDEPQYRDYKISKILGTEKKKDVYDIKGWRLKEDFEYPHKLYKKGTIFIQLEDGNIIVSGNSKLPTANIYNRKYFIVDILPKANIEEIEIMDEKWLHPHLLKELKNKLKIK